MLNVKMTKLAVIALATAGMIGGVISTNSTTASASATKVRYYQNIKNHPYKVTRKHALVYTNGRLSRVTGARLGAYGSQVTVTYAVHVTKNGKKAVYYKFKTAKHTVWTWRGALKRVSSSKVSTKTSTKTNAKTSTATTPTTTTPASNNNVGSTAERNQTFSMNLRDYQRGFLDTVNQERTQRGTSPLAEDSALDGVTATRANEILTHYSHDDTDGNTAFIHECDAAGIDYDTAEVLGFSMINAVYHTANSDNTSTSSETFNITVNNSYNAGKAMVLEYIYYDATSDWGHRDALLNPANNVIGIGAQYAASHGSYRPSVANAAILGAK